MYLIDFLNRIGYIQFNTGVVKLGVYYIINELLNLVFNINIVFYPSIGLVLLLYYIAEFSNSMVLVLYYMQKASIAHHCSTQVFTVFLVLPSTWPSPATINAGSQC